MRIHVLGSSAGGGLPQWNCGCANCRAARDGSVSIQPRHQSSLCVSEDGARWLLVNASPDVRSQLASFAPLAPPANSVRGSGVSAVAVTNGDIDHTAGLLVLREGGSPPIYGTALVRDALTRGLSILPTLEAYGEVHWREISHGQRVDVADRDGCSLGFALEPFAVASKPPPYMMRLREYERLDDRAGDTVGLVFVRGDARVVYVPGVRDLDDALAAECARATAILIDGTFYTDDELLSLGASQRNARTMGHAPMSGPGGTIEFLARFPRARRVFIHINNSNPVLRHDSDAQRAVERAGIEVAYDGLDLVV
ncbi:MAG: pyrroloquinoline quinone biosynthesis protein PqqB [Deltaproteobacteria bacterium]